MECRLSDSQGLLLLQCARWDLGTVSTAGNKLPLLGVGEASCSLEMLATTLLGEETLYPLPCSFSLSCKTWQAFEEASVVAL